MKLDIKPQVDRMGISCYELAKRTNMSYPAVHAIYKSKRTSVQLSTLEALCRALDCTPNDILFLDEEKGESE